MFELVEGKLLVKEEDLIGISADALAKDGAKEDGKKPLEENDRSGKRPAEEEARLVVGSSLQS